MFSLVSHATAQLARLPGIATSDWGTRASEVIKRAFEIRACGVGIATRDGCTTVLHLGTSAHVDVSDGGEILLQLADAKSPAWAAAREGLGGHGTSEFESDTVVRFACGALVVYAVPVRVSSRACAAIVPITDGALDSRDRYDESVAVCVASLGRQIGATFQLDGDRVHPLLTHRECEAIELLLCGLSVRQIASHTGRTPMAIQDRFKSVHRKLGVGSRSEMLARYVYGAGERRSALARHTNPVWKIDAG